MLRRPVAHHEVDDHSAERRIRAPGDVVASDLVGATATRNLARLVVRIRDEDRFGLVVVNGPEEAIDELCVDEFGGRSIASSEGVSCNSGRGGAGQARSRGGQEGQSCHDGGGKEHLERSLCFVLVDVPG